MVARLWDDSFGSGASVVGCGLVSETEAVVTCVQVYTLVIT
jgi:hypothetical protein